MSYRYIGNKTRFLRVLLQRINHLVKAGAVVADPMCGTASVSEALRSSGYRVIAADIMTYSFHHATVRLKLSRPPQFANLGNLSYGDVLAKLQSLDPVQGYFFREFSPAGHPVSGVQPRQYLTPQNASLIDAINLQIQSWYVSGRLEPLELSLLRHDLILAVNRVANIAGTYGHFRSSWSNGSTSQLRLLPTEFTFWPTDGHKILQGRVEDLAPTIAADLCYLDPPYTKRQYAANYHLIETVARGDEPEAVGVSGLRPWRDQYSDFCSKLRIRQSFTNVLNEMDCPRFLISYSEDGLLEKSELLDFLSNFGAVKVWEYEYPRFRSNDSPLDPKGTEYLFLLDRTK